MPVEAKKKGEKTEKVEEVKETKYVVVSYSNAMGVTASSEREAVKKATLRWGSGKYLVVEVDFVEALAAVQRTEIRNDNADSLFPA